MGRWVEQNGTEFADKQVTMGCTRGVSRGSPKTMAKWRNGSTRENAKMRGKCVNDTEQFTIIASRVRGQPGSRTVWQSGSLASLATRQPGSNRGVCWRLKVHLNLNATEREVGNIKLNDQRDEREGKGWLPAGRGLVEILLKLTAAINKINLFHYVNQTRFTDYKDDL